MYHITYLAACSSAKFRAVNARDRSYTAPRLKKLLQDIDATITAYLQKLDAHDCQESTVTTPSADELRNRIARLEQRRKRHEELQAQLAASGKMTLSLTDPDSRPMMSGAGIEICYNVQTAVDAKHKLIVAQTVTVPVR